MHWLTQSFTSLFPEFIVSVQLILPVHENKYHLHRAWKQMSPSLVFPQGWTGCFCSCLTRSPRDRLALEPPHHCEVVEEADHYKLNIKSGFSWLTSYKFSFQCIIHSVWKFRWECITSIFRQPTQGTQQGLLPF